MIRHRRDERSTRTEQWESRDLLLERLAPPAGDESRPATAFPQTITCQTAVDAERVVYIILGAPKQKRPAWHLAQAGRVVSLPNPETWSARYGLHPPIPVPAPILYRVSFARLIALSPGSMPSARAMMPRCARESSTDWPEPACRKSRIGEVVNAIMRS